MTGGNILVLRPGALACRNVEYLLEGKSPWQTMAGQPHGESPIAVCCPCPTKDRAGSRRGGPAAEKPANTLRPRALERGAVEVWNLDEKAGHGTKPERNGDRGEAPSARTAGEIVTAGTLLWIQAGDAATQLKGVWQAWLARFAPEQAGVLAPMVALQNDDSVGDAGEHTRPACREGRPRPSLNTTRRSRTSKKA